MNKNNLWPIVSLGLIGLFSVALLAANALSPAKNPQKPAEEKKISLKSPEITVADPARGSPTAKLTIVEFGDYGCEHCKQAEKIIQEFLVAHPGEVRIVWKDFPIETARAGSREAAEASRCAGRAGKFWEFHDALMSAPNLPIEGELGQIAQTLGLNYQNFLACLGGDFTIPLIDRTFEEGQRLGLDGVPYFFFNGERFSGAPTREVLDAALSAAK